MEDQLNKFREQYYQENKKKTFFTKSQKKDCAEKVSQHFSVDHLLQNSIYVKESTLFFEYPIIKTFIHPNNYSLVVEHIDNMIQYMIENYKTFTMVVNMKIDSLSRQVSQLG